MKSPQPQGTSPIQDENENQKEKKALRGKKNQELVGISIENQHQSSQQALQNLVTTPHWPRSTGVLAFWPMESELSPLPILFQGLDQHKTIGLVRIDDPKSRSLGFYVWTGNESSLIIHPYGIKEPDPSICQPILPAQLLGPDHHWICLVPGLAFDTQGNRLGRGAGYYDRWIRSLRKEHHQTQGTARVLILGLCYELQLISQVPTDDSDEPMDGILTESRLILC